MKITSVYGDQGVRREPRAFHFFTEQVAFREEREKKLNVSTSRCFYALHNFFASLLTSKMKRAFSRQVISQIVTLSLHMKASTSVRLRTACFYPRVV